MKRTRPTPGLAPAADLPRGTKVTLELKDDAKDFSQGGTVEHIIQRYSSFVPFPIELNGKRLNTIPAVKSSCQGKQSSKDK